ncbi:MAG TPA: hypothetical protein VN668_13025 [Stellaceae bacterium]|nr:hypothetical protein [Stellaceae bacterium]
MSREEIEYLRRKAEQLRFVAIDFEASIAVKLLEIAQELEEMALRLEERRSEDC